MHRPIQKILCSFSLTVETPTLQFEMYVRESPFFGSGRASPLAEFAVPPELFHGYTIPQWFACFFGNYLQARPRSRRWHITDKCLNVVVPKLHLTLCIAREITLKRNSDRPRTASGRSSNISVTGSHEHTVQPTSETMTL